NGSTAEGADCRSRAVSPKKRGSLREPAEEHKNLRSGGNTHEQKNHCRLSPPAALPLPARAGGLHRPQTKCLAISCGWVTKWPAHLEHLVIVSMPLSMNFTRRQARVTDNSGSSPCAWVC